MNLQFTDRPPSLSSGHRFGRGAFLSLLALVGAGCGGSAPPPDGPAAASASVGDASEATEETALRHGRFVPRPLILPDPVAEFDGEPITRRELEDHIIRRNQRETFARFTLVFSRMVESSLEKRGITTTEEEVDRELDAILAAANMDLAGLLKAKKYTEEYLRRQVRTRVNMKKYAVAVGRVASTRVDEEFNFLDPGLLDELSTEHTLKFRPHGIPDDAYALVDGEPVAQEEMLYWSVTYLDPEEVLKLLNERIVVRLDDAMIERYGIEVDPGEIEKRYRENASKRGGDTSYEFSLALEGFSREDGLAMLRRSFGIEAIMEREPTDELLQTFFELNRDALNLGDRVRVRDLFVPALAYAEAGVTEPTEEHWRQARQVVDAAWAELQGGAEFDGDFVERHAPPEGWRGAGGDIGWLSMDDTKYTAIRDRALQMEVGEVSEPFQARHGYHILGVIDRKYAATVEDVESDPRVRERLRKRYPVLGRKALREVERQHHDIKTFVSFD